jgi:hypothetical protein
MFLKQRVPDSAALQLGFAFFFLFALGIAALEILDRSNPIRWIAYFVPPLGFLAAMACDRIRLGAPVMLACFFLLIFSFSCLANTDDIDWAYAARDLIIYALLLMTLFMRLPLQSSQIFLSMCCTFLLVFTFVIADTQLNISLHYDPDVVRGESTASIVYAALALFFLINRRWLFAAAALVFAVFTFKRTSYIYFAIVAVLWPFIEVSIAMLGEKHRRQILTVATALVFVGCLWLSYHLIDVLTAAQEAVFPERTLNEITSGRSVLYERIIDAYQHTGLLHGIFGYGPGSVEKLALDTVDIDLAHNEFYHHLYDYGVLGVFFFFAFVMVLLNMRPRYYPVVIYLLLVSVTDNPIYVFLVAVPILSLFALDIDGVAAPKRAAVDDASSGVLAPRGG